MKKLLALILAVIMVLSIMPMAYAKRAEYSPEIEQFIDNYVKLSSYALNKYETLEQQSKLTVLKDELFAGLKSEGLHFDVITYSYLRILEEEDRLDEINVLNKYFKKFIDEVEKKIADDELVIVIDTYEYYKCYRDVTMYYAAEDLSELIDRADNFGSDKYINALSEYDIGEEMINNGIGTQAEYDAALAMVKPYLDLIIACLDGNHPYGEYISDNNATEEADGTKTATCEFCGATDTITDEGTKLEKEEKPKEEEPTEEKVSFFEMIFNLIKEFFEKIFSVFK